MHPAIQTIQGLLLQLKGMDLAYMSPDAISDLRAKVRENFIGATSGLNKLLLNQHSDRPRWLWKSKDSPPWLAWGAIGPPPFEDHWIADFSLIDSGQKESAFRQYEKAKKVLFPCLSLRINISAGYYDPAGIGKQVDPRLTISITPSGEVELSLVEHHLELSKNDFPRSGNGITVVIYPLGGCSEKNENPEDLLGSFSNAASVVREDALENFSDTSLTDGIYFALSFDASVDPERMAAAFEFMGQLFTGVMVAHNNP